MSGSTDIGGGPSTPALDWGRAQEWARPAAHTGRVALAVLLWLIALVIALSTAGLDVTAPVTLVVLATPVVLVARPRLGCVVAIVAAVLLAVSGEPKSVVLPFAVHAAYCTYSLARFLIARARQRRLFADLATFVTITLPEGDPALRRAVRLRAAMIWSTSVVGVALAVWAWLGDHPALWRAVGALGFVVAVQVVRHTAARLAPRRILGVPTPAARVAVRFEAGPRVIVHTADRHRAPVASLRFEGVVHRPEDADAPDVRAATASVDLTDPTQPPDDLFPATVVGDFRAGGYVLVVTGHGVLLPDGPVRVVDGDTPIEIPDTLVDGRQWSGLKRPG
ncbi:hypothetical protein ACFYOT_26780 [Saccharothrix saharensis]|uniref:hypothetical protein n=1 Tax=Saccharothrix saharensis TaxID=571190 RepID=UPI003685B654